MRRAYARVSASQEAARRPRPGAAQRRRRDGGRRALRRVARRSWPRASGELEALGVQLKDYARGLIDFPHAARRARRAALLADGRGRRARMVARPGGGLRRAGSRSRPAACACRKDLRSTWRRHADRERAADETAATRKRPSAEVGPPRRLAARVLRVGRGRAHHGDLLHDLRRAGGGSPLGLDGEHDLRRRPLPHQQVHLRRPARTLPFLPQRDIRRGDIIVFKYPAESDPRARRSSSTRRSSSSASSACPARPSRCAAATSSSTASSLPEYRVEVARRGSSATTRPSLKARSPTRQKRTSPTPSTTRQRRRRRARDRYAVADAFNAVRAPLPHPRRPLLHDGRQPRQQPGQPLLGPRPARPRRRPRHVRHLVLRRERAARRRRALIGFVSNFFNNTRWGRIGTLLR